MRIIPNMRVSYELTNHVRGKMLQYRISESLLKRIMRNPARVEEGIAEHTSASMQKAGAKKSHEIWVMHRTTSGKTLVISAWRYPGTSPVGKPIAIPNDIRDMIRALADDQV